MNHKMGVTFVRVSESYTSKTYPETGEIFNVGSKKTIRLSSGMQVDRDVSGLEYSNKIFDEYSSYGRSPHAEKRVSYSII